MFTQVLWSPKETNDIPAESNTGFQTSLTESRLSFRISEKKSEHFIRIGCENFLDNVPIIDNRASIKAAEMTVIF